MSAIDDLMASVDATNKANPVRQVTHLSDPPRLVPNDQVVFENFGDKPATVSFAGEEHLLLPGGRVTLTVPMGHAVSTTSHDIGAESAADTPRLV